MNKRLGVFLLVTSLLAVCLPRGATLAAGSESVFAKSGRKSISFVDMLFYTSATERLNDAQRTVLLAEIESAVRLPRFDYNPLPEQYVGEFKARAREEGLSIDRLGELVDETLSPHLLKVLDYHKQARALPEAERERFIVIKAKEDGVTAEDLERVMNAAYFFYPFVDELKVTQSGEKEKPVWRARLEAGVAWYHLVYEGAETRIEFVGADRSQKSESASGEEKKFRGKEVSLRDYAILSACEGFAENLEVRVRERFATHAPLEGIDGLWVAFRLGKREGIAVDTKFHIAEYYENEDGELERQNVGYAMARKIADNENDPEQLTRAKGIIGSGYETGMVAIEHPRIGLDVVLGASLLPLEIPAVSIPGLFEIDEDYTSGIYALFAAGQLNLAPATRIPQLFLTGRFTAGAANVEGRLAGTEDLPVFTCYQISVGLLKKYYMSRLAFVVDAEGIYSNLSAKKDVGGVSYEMGLRRYAGSVGAGLEIALTIDVNFGVSAAYRREYIPEDWGDADSYLWIERDDVEQTVPAGQLVEVDQVGYDVKVYFTYSLPTLN
jgi:hypothetical protein